MVMFLIYIVLRLLWTIFFNQEFLFITLVFLSQLIIGILLFHVTCNKKG
jgi:hypothetical protein